MSYEEEDTCHQSGASIPCALVYEEEDTCHMRRRIHVSRACTYVSLAHLCVCVYIYEEEDTCHKRRRIHVT
jgi:hypothetical protein